MTDAEQRKSFAALQTTKSTEISPGKAGLYAMQPLAAAVVTAFSPSAVIAQDNQGGLEEIIVTATKREVNMQDLGQSITAITTGQIEKQAMQSMEDVMRVLPSVSLSSSRPGRNSIIFRGLSTGTQEYYTDSQVAVYLDDQPITTISQQPELRMIDIARVESLPGPQGTLFGSSSQSGTIRYITNKPDARQFTGQIGAELSQTKGGEANHDLNAWINVPIVEDRFAIRAAAYVSHDGGYIDNVLGSTLEGSLDNAAVVEEDYNEWDNVGARIRANWIMNDEWELGLSYIIQESTTDGSWDSDPAIGDFQHTKFFKEFRADDWTQTSATLKGDLGFAELSATASVFDREIVYEWDNMVYEQWKDSYYGSTALYNSDYTFGTIFNDQTVESTTYELRLTSQGDSRFRWMIGGFYEENVTDWFYGSENPDYVGTTSWYAAQAYAYYYNYLGYDVQYPLPATTIGYSETYRNSISQTAIFGQVDYDLTEKWSVNLGLRWFEYDRETDMILQFPQGLAPFGSLDTNGRVPSVGTESDRVIKVGTSYHITDDVMLFGLYSEGFRIGGDNSRRAANTGFVPQTYLSDKVENIELGVKSTFADGRVVLNALAYQVNWNDIQINQSSVDQKWWLRGTINGGEGKNKGFEIDGQWQVTDSLYFYGNITIGDPKYTEDIVRLYDVVPAGTSMVWAFKEKVSLGLEYTIDDVLGGEMWIGYNHQYESEKWNNLNNAIANDRAGIVPAWNIANAHVGLTMNNGWEYQVTIRNVFDNRAINGLYNGGYGELFGDQRFNNTHNYSRPRTVGLNIRKRFN